MPPSSFLCHPLGFPWEEEELVRWGEGRAGRSKWAVTARSWLVCAAWLVPMRPSPLLDSTSAPWRAA